MDPAARPAEVPTEVRTVQSALRHRASHAADQPFVRVGDSPWITASELDERTSAIAAGLSDLGVGAGDRIAIILPNRLEAIELLFAIAKLGAVQVPMNYWLRGSFLRHQLLDCEPRVLVADAEGIAMSVDLLDPSHTEAVVAVDDGDVPGPFRAVRYEQLASGGSSQMPDPVDDPAALLSIMYTSGTTGMPKGCMLSTGYYVNLSRIYREREWALPGDRIHTAYPLFHASGQMLTLMSVLVNGASVCYEPEFHASTFMSRATSLGATALYGVGFMANAILAQPESESDAGRRFRLATWIPLSVTQQLEFERRFNTPVTSEAFGQTEVLPIAVSAVNGGRKRDSAGEILPTMDVRIVDDADEDVPNGVAGEVTVRPRRSNAMFKGYWRNPEATVDAWRGLWHHTGDMAVRDDDGFLTFVDRKKDAIRRRGENVSSFQLEMAIAEHPLVEVVAVCAVPSPLGEDEIKASVVLVEGAELTPEGLFEFLRANVPYFAIPRFVDVRDAMPVNSVGRIMKQALRDEGLPSDVIDFEALELTVPRSERRRR